MTITTIQAKQNELYIQFIDNTEEDTRGFYSFIQEDEKYYIKETTVETNVKETAECLLKELFEGKDRVKAILLGFKKDAEVVYEPFDIYKAVEKVSTESLRKIAIQFTHSSSVAPLIDKGRIDYVEDGKALKDALVLFYKTSNIQGRIRHEFKQEGFVWSFAYRGR